MSDEEQPAPTGAEIARAWVESCMPWRGAVLIGKYGHYCYEWDGLPVDESCLEWPCACAEQLGATPEDIAAAKARNDKILSQHRPLPNDYPVHEQ